MKTPQSFATALAKAHLPSVFKPYRDCCSIHDRSDAPRVRKRNLTQYLEAALDARVDTIWIARDLGYRGGRRTGVPLTDEVHLAFSESRGFFTHKDRLKLTGNPVRRMILSGDRKAALARFGLAEGKPTVFVFGGSRGARRINEATLDAMQRLRGALPAQFILQTGKEDFAWAKDRAEAQALPVTVVPYLTHIHEAYAAADLVVCRDVAHERRIAGALEGELGHPRAPERQREHDQPLLHVARDVEGLRNVGFDRDVEGSAVGEHPLGGDQAHLADLEQLLVDLQPGEAGPVGLERLEPLAHQPLEVALGLLEMLRPKEQSFRPDNAVILRHVLGPSLRKRTPALQPPPRVSWGMLARPSTRLY